MQDIKIIRSFDILKRPYTSVVLFFCCSSISLPNLAARSYADIDLENAVVDPQTWDLVDSDFVYKEKKIDHNSVVRPYISNWTPDGSTGSLKFQVNPIANSTTLKQRVEYYADKSGNFDNTRFIGFHLNVHSDASDIQAWTLLMQCQQLGHWTSPFVALELVNNHGQLELVCVVRNSTHYGINGVNGPQGNRLKLLSYPINNGDWNDILLEVRPGPSGNGKLAVWINHQLVLNWTGALGLPKNFLGYPFVEEYQNSFGIYRKGQASTLSIYFDNYHVSDFIRAAMP